MTYKQHHVEIHTSSSSSPHFPLLAPVQVFRGNHDDRAVAEVRLDRMVSARLVRLLPLDFRNAVYLRLEVMGCGEGETPGFHLS